MSENFDYGERYPKLKAVAAQIAETLREMLLGSQHVDAVNVRAKSPTRFFEKANRSKADGTAKYLHPLDDIQDQIGARIVVFYKSDVDLIANLVLNEFNVIEDQVKEATAADSFGYEARHYVCFIPPAIVKSCDCPIPFFELQVSTLFQHAWAEANHDLGYKADSPVQHEVKRKIAWAAAQAWGADTVFDELWSLCNSNSLTSGAN